MTYSQMTPKNTGDIPDETDWNQIVDNFIAGVPDIFTTKGDLVVASGADAAGRLGVGTNGQLLTADSGETLGVKWADAPSGLFARYSTNVAQAVANDTVVLIDFEDQTFDAESAVMTGASWKFTVPTGESGYYLLSACVCLDTGSWNSGERGELMVYKNGSLSSRLCLFPMHYTFSSKMILHGSTMLQLSATDYIDFRVYQNSGASIDLDGVTENNHVFVARLF